MRIDDNGFAEVARFRRSGDAEAVVTLASPSAADAVDYGCPHEATQVRLVRVMTPTGRVHILLTSLLNPSDYPAADFGDLYHARWRIEEAFKRIKHRLVLEHLTGISWLAAQQDFGAKILGYNLHALSVYCAGQEPEAIPNERNPDSHAPIQTQSGLCLCRDQKPDAALAGIHTRQARLHREAVH
jgi:hypothetical protein